MDIFIVFLLGSACVFAVGAAFFDLKTRKIPNWYNLSGFTFALIVKLISLFWGVNYLVSGLWGLLFGFLIFFPLFALRLVGAGDVKLLSVLGLLVGWKNLAWIFILTSLYDMAILLFIYIKLLLSICLLPLSTQEKLNNLNVLFSSKRSGKNPYGLPVALACISLLIVYMLRPPLLLELLSDAFKTTNLFG